MDLAQVIKSFEAAPPDCEDFELAAHYYQLIASAVPVLDSVQTELVRLRVIAGAAQAARELLDSAINRQS